MTINEKSKQTNKLPMIEVTYKPDHSDKMQVIEDCNCAAILLKEVFGNCMMHHEEVWALYLNQGQKVIGVSQISKGGYSGTIVDNRIIIQIALQCNASSIIIAHNHPSGNLHISEDDLSMTTKLKEACSLFHIKLLDHIILTDIAYNSIEFREIKVY